MTSSVEPGLIKYSDHLHSRLRVCLAACALILWGHAAARAELDHPFQSWNVPLEPFRIVGNLYYVGASEVTAFLIATEEGHVLLDGGFKETAPQILANIEMLGFAPGDVRFLLNSHAHFDHAGGLRALQSATGATLCAMAGDTAALHTGGAGTRDPFLFPAVRADRVLHEGDTVALGGTTMIARLTPGHTAGCTTWLLQVEEDGQVLDVVFVGSPNVLPEMRLVDNPTYPNIASDFARTFEVLRSLPCDVFLGAHGSYFHLTRRIEQRHRDRGPNPFIDPLALQAFTQRKEKAFRERLEADRAATE